MNLQFPAARQVGRVAPSGADPTVAAIKALAAWIPAAVYAYLLASTFAMTRFTIGGNYFLELPLAICIVFGLLVRDPLARAAARALRGFGAPGLAAVAVMLTLFVVGTLVGKNAGYAYGDLRANLTVMMAFLVGWQFRDRDPMPVIRFCLIVGVLSVYDWYSQASSGALDAKFASPYDCLVVSIVLACRARRIVPALASLALLGFLAGVSFYRQYWLAAGASGLIIFGFALTRFGRAERIRLGLCWFLVAIAAAGALHSHAKKIESFFMDDESRYIQSIGKTQNMLAVLGKSDDSMQDSDQIRVTYFRFLAEQPWKLILPHGLGYRWATDNIDPYFNRLNAEVVTIDSLFFYLAFHYGLVMALPLCAWMAASLAKCAREDGVIAAFGLGIVLAIGLLFDGGLAVIVPRAISLGLLVACIAKPVRFGPVPLR